jgi:hypothetical protein
MKPILTLMAVLFLGMTNGLLSQDAVERKTSMSLGPQNAYYVEIPGASKKLAQKTFEEMIKEYGKIKENGKAKEYFMMATKIPVVNGSSPVDLYAKFDEGKDMATVYVFVDLGGAFVNSSDHPSQSAALKQLLYDYFIAVRKKVVAEELKNEEKSLSGLEKDLRKLKDKNEGYHKDIEKAKQKILEAEKNIETNVVEQENKNKEIDTQKVVVEEVTQKLNSLGKKN